MSRRMFALATISVFAWPLAPPGGAFGADVDHYKCYNSRPTLPRFTPVTVSLADSFETTTEVAVKPFELCNPVDKNGEGIVDPTAHLHCYRTRRTPSTPQFQSQLVDVTNQFGTQQLQIYRRHSLCLPAEKNGVASALNINHYKCYKARAVPGSPAPTPLIVNLADQFETKTTQVRTPKLYCDPVYKNNEPLVSPQRPLTCYSIRQMPGQPRFQGVSVSVKDQFGLFTAETGKISCTRPAVLCVPSSPPYGSPTRAFLDRVPSLLD